MAEAGGERRAVLFTLMREFCGGGIERRRPAVSNAALPLRPEGMMIRPFRRICVAVSGAALAAGLWLAGPAPVFAAGAPAPAGNAAGSPGADSRAAAGKAANLPTAQDIAYAFSEAEIIDGFMRTVFGSEGPKAVPRARARVHKFAGPVRVWIESHSRFDDRRASIRAFIRKLDRIIPNLDIALTKKRDAANMTIYLVDRGQYRAMVKERVTDKARATFMEENDCSAVVNTNPDSSLKSALVFIVVNEGYKSFRHCMVEEITQSLGPVNDDASLSYSIYNDYSEVQGFGVFDWFILATVYNRHVKAGMTAAEVLPVLPRAVAESRKAMIRLVNAGAIPRGGVDQPAQ